MSTKPDGGPAFPVESFSPSEEGMTLRDWFAGQALSSIAGEWMHAFASNDEQGKWIRQAAIDGDEETQGAVADMCYFIADAMIAEKRRTEGGATNG